MAPVRRLVVDILKPHTPKLLEYTRELSTLESVGGVSASLTELDQEVQNVELTFEGEDLSFDSIEAKVEDLGGTVHSVDEVSCGEYIVEDRRTLQDD
jgi:hypothetical protein